MKKLSTKSDNKYVGAIINRPNGITLISLVVTIVVLIILAGVTINLSLGENGIFNKAKEAKKAQIIATAKEQIGTEILAAQMDAIERNEELEQSQIEDIISKYGELQEDKDTIILKDNNYKISLLDIYQGTTTTSGSYTENKAKIELLEGQVKRLQEQLDSMSQTGDEKDKTIADLNEKITTIENEKSELQNKNNSLISKETELTNLKETLAKTNTTEDKIIKDYKAYSNGKLITGTMKNYAGKTQDATVTSDDTYAYLNIPNNGYYTKESKLKIKKSNLDSISNLAFGMSPYNGVRGSTWQNGLKISNYKGYFYIIFCGVSQSTTNGRIILTRKSDEKTATITATSVHNAGDGKIIALNITDESDIQIQAFDSSASFAWLMYSFVMEKQQTDNTGFNVPEVTPFTYN